MWGHISTPSTRGQTWHQLSRMLSRNVKVNLFALIKFEPRADSAFTQPYLTLFQIPFFVEKVEMGYEYYY